MINKNKLTSSRDTALAFFAALSKAQDAVSILNHPLVDLLRFLPRLAIKTGIGISAPPLSSLVVYLS